MAFISCYAYADIQKHDKQKFSRKRTGNTIRKSQNYSKSGSGIVVSWVNLVVLGGITIPLFHGTSTQTAVCAACSLVVLGTGTGT